MSSGRDKWGDDQEHSGSRPGPSSPTAVRNARTGARGRLGLDKGKGKGKMLSHANKSTPTRTLSSLKRDILNTQHTTVRRPLSLTGGADHRRRMMANLSMTGERETDPLLHRDGVGPSSSNGEPRPRWKDLFRPERHTVDAWMESWWQRWTVLAVLPTLFVWVWCAMPFPHHHTSDDRPGEGGTPHRSRFDAQFWFFLFWYYGIYCAVGLVYITQLFSLYRLNWWPKALGARKSYVVFWLLSLATGYLMHLFSLDSLPSMGRGWWIPDDDDDDSEGHRIQWQRKTPWVGLAFATMAMPALVCFAGLRRSGRQTYRHSLTEAQKMFLEHELRRRIPASYIRFLWFMAVIGMALIALLAGQGYASVFLSTLPHTGLDGTAYVAFWTVNVNILLLVSLWILEEKVRSRALIFVLKYYYFLVYFIFYRNLFARLNSLDQFALIQLLSSFWVCIWYPFSMTTWCHKIVQYFNSDPKSWEEYVESVGISFYLRNLAQNTTMIAFLGWVSILHFGPNQNMYPFFAFADKRDPYNYQLTMLGSLAIWASELVSSFVARQICLYALDVDVTNLGLDEMRNYPELVSSVAWTSVHVLMDMLLFLIVSMAYHVCRDPSLTGSPLTLA